MRTARRWLRRVVDGAVRGMDFIWITEDTRGKGPGAAAGWPFRRTPGAQEEIGMTDGTGSIQSFEVPAVSSWPVTENPTQAETFRFGVFELDAKTGELRREGRLVHLRHQLQRPGQRQSVLPEAEIRNPAAIGADRACPAPAAGRAARNLVEGAGDLDQPAGAAHAGEAFGSVQLDGALVAAPIVGAVVDRLAGIGHPRYLACDTSGNKGGTAAWPMGPRPLGC